MSDRTKIEWTDATWNPFGGCARVDEGCRNCYAEVMAARFNGPGQWGEGLARIVGPEGRRDHRWTGATVFHEHKLTQPLRWKKPRMIFVNSTSDTFHVGMQDEWLDRIFAVMALAPQHTFQVVTKRPERAAEYFAARASGDPWAEAADAIADILGMTDHPVVLEPSDIPLPNVWIGTSVSDQASADQRIPHLLRTPAAIRFVSYEPALGPVDFNHVDEAPYEGRLNALAGQFHWKGGPITKVLPSLDWIICGGESGPNARDWSGFTDAARSVRDQCKAANTAFFMKQMPKLAPIPADLLIREWPEDMGNE